MHGAIVMLSATRSRYLLLFVSDDGLTLHLRRCR